MDFGRRDSVDDVRFDLPPLDPRSAAILAARPAGAGTTVRIGAPVWSSRAFVGSLYPQGTRPADYLARYAERLFAIELDATYHRTPDPATIDGWCQRVGASFRFCPKVPRFVTEPLDPDGAARFFAAMARFGERLGPVLLQLGPLHARTRLADIERVLDAAGTTRLAVELRHRGWFSSRRLHDDAFRMLAERGVGSVVSDTAGRRDACHASFTTRTVFVRFQGNALHPSDRTRLDAWADRIAELGAAGAEAVYFFVHQPEEKTTTETITHLANRLRTAHGLVAVPPPAQAALFDV